MYQYSNQQRKVFAAFRKKMLRLNQLKNEKLPLQVYYCLSLDKVSIDPQLIMRLMTPAQMYPNFYDDHKNIRWYTPANSMFESLSMSLIDANVVYYNGYNLHCIFINESDAIDFKKQYEEAIPGFFDPIEDEIEEDLYDDYWDTYDEDEHLDD